MPTKPSQELGLAVVKEWKDFMARLRDLGLKGTEPLAASIACWHREVEDMCADAAELFGISQAAKDRVIKERGS